MKKFNLIDHSVRGEDGARYVGGAHHVHRADASRCAASNGASQRCRDGTDALRRGPPICLHGRNAPLKAAKRRFNLKTAVGGEFFLTQRRREAENAEKIANL